MASEGQVAFEELECCHAINITPVNGMKSQVAAVTAVRSAATTTGDMICSR